jgi:hypothetical protein
MVDRLKFVDHDECLTDSRSPNGYPPTDEGSSMIRSTCLSCLLAAGVLALSAPAADATAITSVVISGAGGSGSYTIDNSNPVVPSAYFSVTFTSIAPIDFAVTIDSPGNFYVTSNFPQGVLNNTGKTIDALEFQLLNPTAGAQILGGQSQIGAVLPNLSFPGNYGFELSGPPDLAPGAGVGIGVGYNIPQGPGPITLNVELTPFATAVPEPSPFVLSGMGVLAMAGYALGRRLIRLTVIGA